MNEHVSGWAHEWVSAQASERVVEKVSGQVDE